VSWIKKDKNNICIINIFFYDDFDDSQDFMTESDEELNDNTNNGGNSSPSNNGNATTTAAATATTLSGNNNNNNKSGWSMIKWTWKDIVWMIYEQYQYECIHLNHNTTISKNRSLIQRGKQWIVFVTLLVVEWIRTLLIAMLYDESCMENNYKQMFLNFKKLQWIRRKRKEWPKQQKKGKHVKQSSNYLHMLTFFWWLAISIGLVSIVFALVGIVWKTFNVLS